jgi:hypothetical protein
MTLGFKGARMYYFVIPARTPGVATTSPPFDSLDDAVGGAGLMFSNGTEAGWIIDHDGKLVLSADQLKLRLQTQERRRP